MLGSLGGLAMSLSGSGGSAETLRRLTMFLRGALPPVLLRAVCLVRTGAAWWDTVVGLTLGVSKLGDMDMMKMNLGRGWSKVVEVGPPAFMAPTTLVKHLFLGILE